MEHGTRACYQHSRCRCLPCRLANATYQATYRLSTVRGEPRNSVVSSRPALSLLNAFRREWLSQYRLSRELGRHDDSLRVKRSGITRRKLAQIERLARFYEIQTTGMSQRSD